MLVYLNGLFLEEGEAAVPADHPGLLAAATLFETLPAIAGVPLFAEAHLARIRRSARALGFPPPPRPAVFRAIVARLARAAGTGDLRIRLTLAPSGFRISDFGSRISDFGKGREPPSRRAEIRNPKSEIILVTARPLPPRAPGREAEAIGFSRFPHPDDLALSGHKMGSFLFQSLCASEREKRGWFDVLLLTARGRVAEGSRANVFWVRRGRVFTPGFPVNVLPGVTRGIVLRLCRRGGIPCAEGSFGRIDLGRADEVFLTNSLAGVAPVASVDGRVRLGRGDPAPGPVTRRLMDAYEKSAARYITKARTKSEGRMTNE